VSAWLFDDWPEGSFARDRQVLATAVTRLRASLRLAVRDEVRRWVR